MEPLFMNINEVNKLPSEQFIKIFGNVVEHCPAAAICILKNRPFSDVRAISEAINWYLNSLNDQEMVKVMQLHPDLAGKLADLRQLSSDSDYEQTTVGLFNLSADDKHKLTYMNEEYRIKFGFPFIVCVREKNDTSEILQAIETRLTNNKDREIYIAMEEVKKICRLRILALVKN